MTAVHYGPGHGTGHLTPADELDEIELGIRADTWLTLEQLARVYGEEERPRAMTRYLVASVAQASREAGWPYPDEWQWRRGKS